jgi:Rrf2 family protein
MPLLYSSACGYAIRALTDLAGQPDRGFRQLQDIARAEGIPPAFLGKVLQTLVRVRLLTSSKGPGGGYRLARPPGSITLLAIKAAIDGTADLEGCASGLGRCSDDMPCPQHERFKPLRLAMKDYLSTTTVADMARALDEKRTLLAKTRAGRGGHRTAGSRPR